MTDHIPDARIGAIFAAALPYADKPRHVLLALVVEKDAEIARLRDWIKSSGEVARWDALYAENARLRRFVEHLASGAGDVPLAVQRAAFEVLWGEEPPAFRAPVGLSAPSEPGDVVRVPDGEARGLGASTRAGERNRQPLPAWVRDAAAKMPMPGLAQAFDRLYAAQHERQRREEPFGIGLD